MSFYTDKKRALKRIDELITDQVPISVIYYKIETEYGFSEAFVNKRIERLKEIQNVSRSE